MVSRVTVLGASGFVGRYIVERLAGEGAAICACSRHARDAGFLRPMGDVGQVALFDVDIRNERALAAVVAGSDAVVNAVGIIVERGQQTFEAVHHLGPARLAKMAKEAGVRRFVHISSISADASAPSLYARTKAAGEEAVRAAFPDAVILRPALVFGPEDAFFNRFAAMARFLPVLPLIGDGRTKFQPVYVGDVAAAVTATLEKADVAAGKTYDIAGPVVFDLKQIFAILLHVIGRKRLLLPIPFGLASLQAFFLEFLPSPPFTRDQVRMLKRDAIARPGMPGLKELGILPQALELVLPSYLDRYRRAGALGFPIRPARP